MIESSDQPTVYRFAGNDRTYGPRALDWVVQTYGENPTVSAAAERSADSPASWRPVAEWAAGLPAAPASSVQRARLQKLGNPSIGALTFGEAADAIEAAESAARGARGRRQPTALKLRRLAELGITAPPNASRADVDDLIRDHGIAQRAMRLADAGMRLPADGVSEDNIHALEEAVEALRLGLEHAAERGLVFEPAFPLTADAMMELADTLEEFWSIAGDLEDSWSLLADSGDLPRVPTAAERCSVLPALLEELSAARWSDVEASYLSLGLKALTTASGSGAS